MQENRILNLTQHQATEEQKAQGVFDLKDTTELKALLTFDGIPSHGEMYDRARRLAQIARHALGKGCHEVMIGGAPFFMSTLENYLWEEGMVPVYAFSQRHVVESVKEDGTVVKTAVFKHVGFVKATAAAI